MNSATVFCIFAIVVASVQGGSHRLVRAAAKAPATTGTNIEAAGASQAVGIGSAVGEHGAVISVSGDNQTPGILSFGGGSSVGLSQSASNYQQTQINADGSSAAYQGNYASNDGYGNDYLSADVQGLNVDVVSSGWSAVEGEGAIGQADALEHTGPASSSSPGWRAPQ